MAECSKKTRKSYTREQKAEAVFIESEAEAIG